MSRIRELNFRLVPSPREIEWTRILERWKSSGLSGRAFCEREGLGEPVFYSWKRKLRLRGEAQVKPAARKAVQFIPVEVKSLVTIGAPLEVVVGLGRVVRVPSGFDAAELKRLLLVLEERSC